MSWINSYETLIDFLSMVIVHAPDDFPKEDYLRDDDQLTLEKAFDEINRGMHFVPFMNLGHGELSELQGYIDASLAAYQAGDDVKGAHLLQDFENKILRQGH